MLGRYYRKYRKKANGKINVRVDSALKQEAEALFNDLGLNMSSVMELQNTREFDSLISKK